MALSSVTSAPRSRPTSRRSSQPARSAGSSGMVAIERFIAGSFHALRQAGGRLVERLVRGGLLDPHRHADFVVALARGPGPDDGPLALVEPAQAAFELRVDLAPRQDGLRRVEVELDVLGGQFARPGGLAGAVV